MSGLGLHARSKRRRIARVRMSGLVVPIARRAVMARRAKKHGRGRQSLHGECKHQQPHDEGSNEAVHANQFSLRRVVAATAGSACVARRVHRLAKLAQRIDDG